MGLETGNEIADLNQNWPLGTDPKSQGDDHIRLVKKVIQNDALSLSDGGTIIGAVFFDAFATFQDDVTFDEVTFFEKKVSINAVLDVQGLLTVGDDGLKSVTATGPLFCSTLQGEVKVGDGGNNAYLDASTGHSVELRSNGTAMLHLDPAADHILEVGNRQFVLNRTGFSASLGVASNGNLQISPAAGQSINYNNASMPTTAGADGVVLNRAMGDNRYNQTAAAMATELRTLAAVVMLMEALDLPAATRAAIRDVLEAGE